MTVKVSNRSDWYVKLEEVNNLRKATPWTMARLILYGIENFCQSKDEIVELYDEASEQLEISRKTLQNYASVARRFDENEVHERLEIGHHIAVVAMPAEIAHQWLQAAEENAWSVARLRQEIRLASQTPNEEDDGDESAGRNLVIQYLSRNGISAHADDRTVSMAFPDGRHVNIGSTSPLDWSLT